MTSTQAMNDIHVSGLIEIPDNIFEIAMPRQEFQLTEYKTVDRSEPTVGLHSLHELHHLLTAQNKTDKLGPIQTQNVLADGAPELSSNSFRAKRVSEGITLRTGAPYQHTDQTTAERVQGTIQRMSLTMRVASGLPQVYSAYADKQAAHIIQRLPTSKAIASQVPSTEHPRPLSPFELRTGIEANSFQ